MSIVILEAGKRQPIVNSAFIYQEESFFETKFFFAPLPPYCVLPDPAKKHLQPGTVPEIETQEPNTEIQYFRWPTTDSYENLLPKDRFMNANCLGKLLYGVKFNLESLIEVEILNDINKFYCENIHDISSA